MGRRTHCEVVPRGAVSAAEFRVEHIFLFIEWSFLSRGVV